MEGSFEIASGMIDDIPVQVRQEIVKHAGNFSVALFGVSGKNEPNALRFLGSGSLVTISGFHYILTAAHVWLELKRYDHLALTLIEHDSHRFLIDTRTINDTTIWAGKGNEWGPDLAFLRLPSSHIGTIKAYRVFYDLAKRCDEALRTMTDTTMGLWVIMGCAAADGEFTERTADLQFAGWFSGIKDSHAKNGFDFLDVGVDISLSGVPASMGGVSGGGLWQVMIARSARSGEFSWNDGINLEGVAFWQSDPVDKRRIVRCHGRRSIYEATQNLKEAG